MGASIGSRIYGRVRDWSIPDASAFPDEETLRKARLTVAFACALGPCGPLFGLVYFLLGCHLVSIFLTFAVIFVWATLLVLRKTGSVPVAGNYVTGALVMTLVVLELGVGGSTHAPLTWIPLAPLMAICLVGRRSAYAWGVVSTAVVGALLFLEHLDLLGSPPIPRGVERLLFSVVMAGLTMVCAIFGFVYESLKDTALGQVKAARDEMYRKRLQAELALRDLESTQTELVESRKMTALSEISGGLAHEINNPLAAIQVLAAQLRELLEEEPLDVASLGKMAATIDKTTIRIAQVVSALRAFSRDAGDAPKSREAVSGIVVEALALLEERMRSRRVHLILGEMPDVHVDCRRLQIAQAIFYLLHNAFDAVSLCDEPRWIGVSAALDGDRVRIAVSDSGPGVPKPIRDKIFQPFFTTKPVGGGSGLGLSTARGLAEAHGGRIELDLSKTNTTFVIVLPVAARSAGSASVPAAA